MYCVALDACLPIPGLLRTSAPAEAILRAGAFERMVSEPTPLPRLTATPSEVTIAYEPVGAILVREGREIIVDAAPGADADLVRLFVLGPALAALMRQRGMLVLHACAVARDGACILLLGGKGWGKSSLAAALYARGWSLVADDVAPLQLSGDGPPVALPGLPQIKIWPEAAAACLGPEGDDLLPLVSGYEKRALRVERGFPTAPVPVERLYVLDGGDEPAMEPIRPSEALLELVRHSYYPRLLKDMGVLAEHFRQCGDLVQRVPAYRLCRPDSLQRLPDLARFVEEHVRAHA